MAAPKGNHNAIGNKGGRKPLLEEKKISKFKGLVLDYATEIMEGKNIKAKQELVLRAINNVLPRTIEGTGLGGEFIFKWLKS